MRLLFGPAFGCALFTPFTLLMNFLIIIFLAGLKKNKPPGILRFLCLLTVVFSGFKADAIEPEPDWTWAFSANTTNYSACGNHGMAVDGKGNVWLAGDFSGDLKFPGGGGISTSSQATLLLHLASGGDFVNAKAVYGQMGQAIALNSAGQPVIAGATGSSPGFFVAQYDKQENLLWVQATATGSIVDPEALAVDANGDVFVAGQCQAIYSHNTCSIGTNQFDATHAGDKRTPFVAKLSGANGDVLWAVSLPVTTDHSIAGVYHGNGISVDDAGHIYVTGSFHSYVNPLPLWPFGSTILNAYNEQLFLAKFDSAGHLLNIVQTFNGSDLACSAAGEDVAADSQGHVYVTGQMSGSGAQFFSEGNPVPNFGGVNTFLVQYNDNLTVRWTVGARCSGSDAIPYSVKVDPLGNAFVFGTFDLFPWENGSSLTFDTIPTYTESVGDYHYVGNTNILSSATNTLQGFIAKYDAKGHFHWAKQISGDTSGNLAGIACAIGAVDPAANVYVGGSGYGTNQFGDIYAGSTNDTLAAYVAKLATTSPPIKVAADPDSGIQVYWSKLADGFYLQTSSNLQDWADDSQPMEQDDYNNFVNLPVTTTGNTVNLYRLVHKP